LYHEILISENSLVGGEVSWKVKHSCYWVMWWDRRGEIISGKVQITRVILQ